MDFLKVNKPKQDKIINVALKLFSQNGYKNTSTNEIVKESEISKGLLFHYFNSKKELYLYLYNYCAEFCINEFKKQNFEKHTDLFDFVIEGQKVKCNLIKQYPYIFDFIISAYKEKTIEINIDKQNNLLIENIWEQFFKRMDKSKFENEKDIPTLIKIITWCGNGIIKEVLEKDSMDIEKERQKFEDIMLVLKRNFYKEEYL